MQELVRLVGPHQTVEILGITLMGVNAENGKRLLFTLAFVAVVLLLERVLEGLACLGRRDGGKPQWEFWLRQAVRVAMVVLVLVGLASVWFDDPTHLATAVGLVTAGLAVALQKVITAVVGYVVILRGHIFQVGDRIVIGGVRGDVIALSFTKTTLMEMGQSPPVQSAAPAMWVQSRQYTGRLVTVSNASIFEEPVYNYTRDFPYLWEEMSVPISYAADRQRAEHILLQAAEYHALALNELGEEALQELQRRYLLRPADVRPRVYYRLTDNWLELTVRFLTKDHGIREQKDAMSRDILQELEAVGIGIASTTLEIVGLPPLHIQEGMLGGPVVASPAHQKERTPDGTA